MVIAVLIYGGILALVLVIIGQWYTDRQFIRNQLVQRVGSNRTPSPIAEFESRISEKKAEYLRSKHLPFEGLTAFSTELNQYFDDFKVRVSNRRAHRSATHLPVDTARSFPWKTPYDIMVLRKVGFWLYLHDTAEELREQGLEVQIKTPNQTINLEQVVAQAFDQFFFQLKSYFSTDSSLEITGSRNAQSLTVDITISGSNIKANRLEEMVRSLQSTHLRVSTAISKSAQLEIQVLISNIGE